LDCTARDHDDHANCRRRPRLAYVESGLLLGTASGVDSYAFSNVTGVWEVGLLAGARTGRSTRGWGLGFTGFFAFGNEDARTSVKPRVRYRVSPGFAVDVSAGPVWTYDYDGGRDPGQGYLASVAFQLGSWFTLRSDFQTRPVPDWNTRDPHTGAPLVIPGGNENAVYVGLAMRDRPGWSATIIGAGAVTALFLLAIAFVLGGGGWA
jgi:hypothetical protein